MSNIIEFPVKHEDENKLVQDIKNAVYSYSGKITTAAAFGCLVIATRELEQEIID